MDILSTNFGKYRLIAELGHGGMADVFLAVAEGPEDFNKLVVVKRIRDTLAEDPLFIDMIVDEARLAARLGHPNTVQTFDVGQVDGRWFIAMEYLDGQPLSRLLSTSRARENPLPLDHALTILVDVLNGLDHAHELCDYDGSHLSVVHRDVSPQNIFVTYDGHAKIVDFGIAKARGRNVQTTGGTIKGKVMYMAPEQVVAAAQVDRRADIFAAGVVLWEILAGRRMWEGMDDIAIMACLISGVLPESPRTVNESVPPELDVICRRALSHDRDKRQSTARDMAEEILAYLRTSSASASLQRHEIGSFVSSLFAARRRAMGDLIDNALAGMRSSGPRSSRRQLAQATTEPSELTAVDVTFTEARVVSSPTDPSEPTSTAALVMPATARTGGRRRWRVVVGAAVALVAIAIAATLTVSTTQSNERAAADSSARRKVAETLGARPLASDPAITTSRTIAPHSIDSSHALRAVRGGTLLPTKASSSAAGAIVAAPSASAHEGVVGVRPAADTRTQRRTRSIDEWNPYDKD